MKSLFVFILVFANVALAQGTKGASGIAPASAPKETPVTVEAEGFVPEDVRFSIGASLSLTTKVRFDEITVTGSSTKIAGDFDYENALSLEADIRKFKEYGWGFIAGLTIDGERKLTGGTLSGGGASVTLGSANPSKIQVTILSASAVYGWKQFYLPFGLNVSSVKFTPSAGFSGTHTNEGGLGVQLGGGYYITKNFAFEAMLRSVAIKLTSTTTTGSKTDYGTGYMSNLLISGKFIF